MGNKKKRGKGNPSNASKAGSSRSGTSQEESDRTRRANARSRKRDQTSRDRSTEDISDIVRDESVADDGEENAEANSNQEKDPNDTRGENLHNSHRVHDPGGSETEDPLEDLEDVDALTLHDALAYVAGTHVPYEEVLNLPNVGVADRKVLGFFARAIHTKLVLISDYVSYPNKHSQTLGKLCGDFYLLKNEVIPYIRNMLKKYQALGAAGMLQTEQIQSVLKEISEWMVKMATFLNACVTEAKEMGIDTDPDVRRSKEKSRDFINHAQDGENETGPMRRYFPKSNAQSTRVGSDSVREEFYDRREARVPQRQAEGDDLPAREAEADPRGDRERSGGGEDSSCCGRGKTQ
jgi:hypothetical protein